MRDLLSSEEVSVKKKNCLPPITKEVHTQSKGGEQTFRNEVPKFLQNNREKRRFQRFPTKVGG